MVERIDIVVSERGSRRVSRNIAGIGTAATASQGAVSLLKRALGLLGGALIIGNAVRTLANFGQAMSTVKAITQATGDTFSALTKKAKELGSTTRFSASEAADGMIFLARTGFDAGEVIAAIGPALTLAQAGALGLGDAANIASNILKGFGLNAAETGRIVDVLALTANSSNTTVQQLGDAMSFAATSAKSLGVSVEETAAAVGVLGDAGIPASRAGVGLRTIFIKLIKPTGAAKAAIKRLGLEVSDLDVGARGIIPVLQSLRDANVQLSEAADLVGVRQANSLLVLKDTLPQLKKLADANLLAAGTAKRVADVMDDNLNGALFAVKSATEAVILALGELGADAFLTNSFRNLAAVLRTVAANIDDVAAAVGFLAGAFLALKLPALIGLFKVLAIAIGSNPVLALTTAVILAGSAMILFRDEIKLTEDGAVTFADAMEGAANVISGQFTRAVRALGFEFGGLGPIVKDAAADIGRGLIGIVAIANGVVEAMIRAFEIFPDALRNIGIAAFNGFLIVAQTALNLLVKDLNEVISFLRLPVDPFELFDFENLKAQSFKIGRTMKEAFNDGFNAVVIEVRGVADARRALENAGNLGGGFQGNDRSGPARPTARVDTTAKVNEAFEETLKNLREQNELLKVSGLARTILLEIQNAGLTVATKENELQRARITIAATVNHQLQVERDILNEIKGPQETYIERLAAINALQAANKITAQEAADATRDLKIALLESSTDLEAGVERAFLKLQRQAGDSAAIAEKAFTVAFESASDALTEFVTTGKISFSGLIKSMLADITKLIIKQALLKAVGGIFGGGGGFPGFADGGFFTLNDPAPVAANGGLLRGPGTGRSDSINTRLSNGEFVTNAASTARFLPLLQGINGFPSGGGGSGSGGGGGVVVQVIDQRSSEAPPVERQEGTDKDGRKTVAFIIRDAVKGQIASGEFDRSLGARFNLRPAVR